MVKRGSWRIESWIHKLADRMGPTPFAVRSRDRRTFLVDGRDHQYRMGLLARGVFESSESDVAERCLGRGHVVVDVGANFGWYTTLFAAAVGAEGHVHAFEPQPRMVERIRKNCALNGLHNVTVTGAALGSRDGTCTIHVPIQGPSGDACMFAPASGGASPIECPLTTLDGYAGEAGFTRCDLIKCDAEGAEVDVFRGAVRTLQRFRPALLVELNAQCLSRAGHTPANLREEICRHVEYVFGVVRAGGRVEAMPEAAWEGRESYVNVIAVAPESPLREALGL